ncbi:hypothetical protein ACWGSK_13220 [Nocardiopsis sp. NPDC055551]
MIALLLMLLAAFVVLALVVLLMHLTGGLFLITHERTLPRTKTTTKENVR